MPDLLDFYLTKNEIISSCLVSLRDLILGLHPNIAETRKYGMPCFTFKGKQFCYLWTDKETKEPYVLIIDGDKLNHGALEKGKRSRMKSLRVASNEDLQLDLINTILNDALRLRQ